MRVYKLLILFSSFSVWLTLCSGILRSPGARGTALVPSEALPGAGTVPGSGGRHLHVKFRIGDAGPAWTRVNFLSRPSIHNITRRLRQMGIGRPSPLFQRLESDYYFESHDPASPSAGHAPDLRAWFRFPLPELPDSPDRARVAQRGLAFLRAHPAVLKAYREPILSPAVRILPAQHPGDGDSCPIRTPPYDHLQDYARPAPGGIDVAAAWPLRGGRGEGVWFADIEGAWNAAHEDLPSDRIVHLAGDPIPNRHWEAHGTAVLGVVTSRDNGLGMMGLAPDVDRVFTGSLGGIGAAAAFDRVAARLRPGDVMLIELHGPGPRSRYGGSQRGFVPMEWWDAEFEAIKLATSKGRIVVEAAGNGSENLDDAIYEGRFDRKVRDSGAIMVGAGAPPSEGYVDRSRLDFSNHGSRVDLQGYGRRVATLDYGDLQSCSDNERKYTEQFAGTSSASPVVVGAILALQGIHKARIGEVLDGDRLRAVLQSTGSPQTDGPHGPSTENVGPRPDLRGALDRLFPGAAR